MHSDNGTIFHTAWWYRAWGIEPSIHALIGEQGKIAAGICFASGRWFGVKGFARPPLTPRNGPIFSLPDVGGRHKRNSLVKKMTLAAIHSLPKLGIYDIFLDPCETDVIPYIWNGFDAQIKYTYVIPCEERETWLKQASKTQQWSIRKAGREVAEGRYAVDLSPSFDEVASMLAATADFKGYSNSGYVNKMPDWWRIVAERGQGNAYLLRDAEGKPASAALMVWDSRCAYYVAGGIRPDLRKGSLVNVLLIHRMIEDAHAMGLDFDFEGSVLPGVERFFRSFGGELRPLYRLTKLPSLWSCLVWYGHLYWTGHRKRRWIWHD